jgi:glycosyl transferase family 25
MTAALPPVLLLSLKEATQRRAEMAEKLGRLGLPYSVFDAVDGRGRNVNEQPVYDGVRRRLYFGRDMTGGEIGCLLSHREILERVAAGDEPFLVIEDDAILHPDLPKVVAALMQRRDYWELVRFLGSPKVLRSRQRRLVHLVDEYWLTRLASMPGGTHALIVSPSGARKLLRRLNRTAFPIDALMNQSWRTGVANLTVHPGVAIHDEEQVSFIENTRFDKRVTATGWERALLPLARALWKLEENLGKYGVYYGAWLADVRRRKASETQP